MEQWKHTVNVSLVACDKEDRRRSKRTRAETLVPSHWLYNEANQLYAYIYPLSLEPPSHPSRSAQSTELSSLCYTAASHYLSISHVLVFHQKIYKSVYFLSMSDLKTNKQKKTLNFLLSARSLPSPI